MYLVPALGIVGLVDDFKSLMPWPRLVIQTSVGFFLSAYLAIYGTRPEFIKIKPRIAAPKWPMLTPEILIV